MQNLVVIHIQYFAQTKVKKSPSHCVGSGFLALQIHHRKNALAAKALDDKIKRKDDHKIAEIKP